MAAGEYQKGREPSSPEPIGVCTKWGVGMHPKGGTKPWPSCAGMPKPATWGGEKKAAPWGGWGDGPASEKFVPPQ